MGADNKAYKEKRVAGAQSISGTGSLRLGLTFFEKWYPHKDIDILLPAETWPLHRGLIDIVGLPTQKPYRWFHPEDKNLDFQGMCEDLNSRIKQIARPIYSNPPIHGARIVDIILGDEEL